MLKALMLCELYNIWDEQFEYQCGMRYRSCAFLACVWKIRFRTRQRRSGSSATS